MAERKRVWFGTRGYETWLRPWNSGADSSRVGYSGNMQYLNGGAGIRASQAAHREYNLTWGDAVSRDEIRPYIDFAEGVFDSEDGVNLIYFIDPMTADKNVLPQNWATPAQAGSDGIPLFEDQEPTMVGTPDNEYRYPARGARYTTSETSRNLYLPIPPGYTAWVGVHGEATGTAALRVTEVVGATQGATTLLDFLEVTDPLRVDTSFTQSSSCTGIVLDIAGGATDTITLYGIMAQILPNGVTPATGAFISGQGHSGCQFASHPQETPYSFPLDQMSMTAKLVETGSWI